MSDDSKFVVKVIGGGVLAVAILYFAFFSGKKPDVESAAPTNATTEADSSPPVIQRPGLAKGKPVFGQEVPQ